jgi:hypothetical protein
LQTQVGPDDDDGVLDKEEEQVEEVEDCEQ